MHSGSSLGFFRRGLTSACFIDKGTIPVSIHHHSDHGFIDTIIEEGGRDRIEFTRRFMHPTYKFLNRRFRYRVKLTKVRTLEYRIVVKQACLIIKVIPDFRDPLYEKIIK